jgi:triosephosphate isomerase (TIM)
MRTKIVAGNWKMNGSRAANAALIDGVLVGVKTGARAECVVCPPFVYLADIAAKIAGSSIRLGAQNVSHESSGAFTGEVAAAMLRDLGCAYAIVGHSERRALYGESSALVAQKFMAAQGAGIVPILCVGEQLADREAGKTSPVVAEQLDAVLELAGVAAFRQAVIAYEPVWAIGTGRTASPEQAQEVHEFIRGRIASRDAIIGGSVRILYGGSVKGSNARELLSMPDVDGGLIGGASLKADEFLAILAAATG